VLRRPVQLCTGLGVISFIASPGLFNTNNEATMSIAAELERLRTLRDNGAISEDEFLRAKARVLDDPAEATSSAKPLNVLNQLRRSRSDSVLGGVCGGLGRYTGVPAWGWRVLFCLSVLCIGFGVLLYVLLWLFVPPEA